MAYTSAIMRAHDAKLTKQEKKVVELLSNGYSSKQIAGYLNTSQNTIDNHRKNMLKKTHTKNVAELVAVAIRQNII